MTKYNYLEELKKDIKTYLEDNFDYKFSDCETKEELQEELYDILWTEDSVTGNGSGSYTFCRETAKNHVVENTDLCAEALKEFCVESETIVEKFLSEDWEYFDVTIRCYMLGWAISEVIEEIEL